ncbi:hypothetical protein [Streptosporangium sp. NPDC002721]|uniref:hypothetical protein n=1 Tax=Streptosporangium sp. NPDC002721 TaxID=3366188 RepID=UPI00367FF6E6
MEHQNTGGKGVTKDPERPGGGAATVTPIAADPTFTSRRRTADRVFQVTFAYTVVLTILWLAMLLSGGGGTGFFRRDQYEVNAEVVSRIVFSFLFFTVLWGWIWYGVKIWLLRSFVGMTKEDRRLSFTSRMQEPYDLDSLLARYSERRIRIADMIGRRGRTALIAATGFAFVYMGMLLDPGGNPAQPMEDHLFDAMIFSWVSLALYYSNGFLARVHYGAQARIMDGVLSRANLLLVSLLWSLFKFIMLPIGTQLGAVFPEDVFPVLFILIWGSYIVSDSMAEIVGSMFGKQKLRVWGVGEVNRKSVAGTWATFVSALLFSGGVVLAHGLAGPWLLLALALAVSNTVLELFSPRGTDDFTMATGNALICWGFGLWVL